MTREIPAAKGGTVGDFALNSDFHVNLGIFYMLQIYDMAAAFTSQEIFLVLITVRA